jgi:hypothetical protein
MSVLTDDVGNKSSKRLMAFVFGISATVLGLVLSIMSCFIDITTTTIFTTTFTGLVSSSLICLGLTIPEKFRVKK